MNIFVDADASPVQKEVIEIGKRNNLHVYLVKSYAHFSNEPLPEHVTVIYVDHGRDMADFAIVERINKNDIVITQDYGLASLCLAKRCHVLHHKGFVFTEKNIDQLLASRYESAKARRSGLRTKGPKPFTNEEREKFIVTLQRMIDTYIDE